MIQCCAECGKPFKTYPCWVKRGTKFCSRECAYRSDIRGDKISQSKRMGGNLGWMERNPKYHGIHSWIKRHYPKPLFCSHCNQIKVLDLHNYSGKYTKDLDDWGWLCRSCHMKVDGRDTRRLTNGTYASKS